MLELDRVHAGYGDTAVLRDVSLVAPDGAVTALLGPNGVGKTTLLRVASGLLRPAGGAVRLDDADVTGWGPHRRSRRGVCHVPEGRGVFPGLTVRDNLVLYARPGQEQAAVERAVSAFPVLGSRLDQVAGTMSGGEQQMLALSRAYVAQPRLVLLDEVSMGLAPQVIEEVFGFLHRLAEEGAALLIVEQYVTRVLAMADYVYLLGRGRVVFAGEPAELADEDVFRAYFGTAA